MLRRSLVIGLSTVIVLTFAMVLVPASPSLAYPQATATVIEATATVEATATAPQAPVATELAPDTAAATPTTAAASWDVSTAVRVRAGIPFSWLRASASSLATPLDYAPTGDVLVVISNQPQADAGQWWWQVRRAQGRVIGWVEQASLVLATAEFNTPTATFVPSATPSQTPTPTLVVPGTPVGIAPADWKVGNLRTVRPEVAFVWVRSEPSSTAPKQITLGQGWLVIIQSAEPRWDGSQWWWQVYVPAYNTTGWVEQALLF